MNFSIIYYFFLFIQDYKNINSVFHDVSEYILWACNRKSFAFAFGFDYSPGSPDFGPAAVVS